MTEEEAKGKICPQLLTMVTGVAVEMQKSGNAGQKEIDKIMTGSFCVASKCMMWRDYTLGVDCDPHGYCGLGGKP